MISAQLDLDFDGPIISECINIPARPGLLPDPKYKSWLRSPILGEWQRPIIEQWAKELRAAWLDGRPHGIEPEPKYRWMLDCAAMLAGI